MTQQLIRTEDFTSIQEAQAGLTKLFSKAALKGRFYRVMKSNRSLGVLIPDNVWDSFLEDLEALASPEYIETIAKSRASKKRFSAEEIKKELDL